MLAVSQARRRFEMICEQVEPIAQRLLAEGGADSDALAVIAAFREGCERRLSALAHLASAEGAAGGERAPGWAKKSLEEVQMLTRCLRHVTLYWPALSECEISTDVRTLNDALPAEDVGSKRWSAMLAHEYGRRGLFYAL